MLLLAIDDHALPVRKHVCLHVSKPVVRAEPVLAPSPRGSGAPDDAAAMFYGTVLYEPDFRGRAGGKAAGGGAGEAPPVTPTRPVGLRESRDLFPGGSLRCEPVSLDYRLAPLAGRRPVPGQLLSAAPFLRTHYLSAVRKPAAGGKP